MALDSYHRDLPARRDSHARRLALVLVLGTTQMLTTSWLFSFADDLPRWSNPVFLLRMLILTGLLAAAAFVLIAWPARAAILAAWQRAQSPSHLRRALAFNLCLFALLVPATILLTDAGQSTPSPPWHLFWPYVGLLAATAATLANLYAPPRFWIGLAAARPLSIAVAMAAAAVTQLGSIEAQQGWESLATATLTISYGLLAVLAPSTVVDFEARKLTVANFWVIIDASCSGYEGVALVSMAIVLYLVVFRDRLRFPAALALLPIGITAVWLLNAVRIAVLALIGGYLSPDVALKGFHSQAGWLTFLAVTTALMVSAHRLPVFNSAVQHHPRPAANPADREALALLAPLMGLLAGHILIAAAEPHGAWLVIAKFVLIAAPLALFRDIYARIATGLDPVAIATGLLVGVVWITTAGPADPAHPLAAFLSAQAAPAVAVWLIARAVVGILLVPVAEELAFRGFLYRLIALRGPVSVAAVVPVSMTAIAMSSALFAALHERWLLAALAGVVFALVMLRRGRLGDAVMSHVAANAVVVGWAIATRHYGLI